MPEPPAKFFKLGYVLSEWVFYLLWKLRNTIKLISIWIWTIISKILSRWVKKFNFFKKDEINGCYFVILIVIFFSPRQQNNDEKEAIEFYLRLCFDVLSEVFRFGDRRKLTKLERIGRRFHWLIEKWFLDVPFLRLNLKLYPTGYLFFFSFIKINKEENQKKRWLD